MRDSRITIFTGAPLAITTATTTNGATIDLQSGYVGDYIEGAPAGHGLGIEIIFSSITGSQADVDCYWQVSLDGSTWETDQKIIEGALDQLDGSISNAIRVKSRLRTTFRYARVVIVSSNMGGSSFNVNAWVTDASIDQAYGQKYLVKS